MTPELRCSGDLTLSAWSGVSNAILISSDLLTSWLIPTATIFDVQFCKKKENYKAQSVTSNRSPGLSLSLQDISYQNFVKVLGSKKWIGEGVYNFLPDSWKIYNFRISVDSALDFRSRGLGRALAEDIVLCSWVRHFTLTVPLTIQEYKWVSTFETIDLANKWGYENFVSVPL